VAGAGSSFVATGCLEQLAKARAAMVARAAVLISLKW